MYNEVVAFHCRPRSLQKEKKKGIDKLIIAAHLSIKMRFSLWHKSDFFKQCQMNARSNNANLVLILRNPLLFSEGIHKSWPPSPQGFIKKHDLCTCWGGIAVMFTVIQILIRLFRI